MNVAQTSWLDANQRYLWAALASVRTALESYVQSMSGMAGDRLDEREAPGAGVGGQTELITAAMPAPATLDTVCSAFGLTGFERDLLLLCAGVEMDTAFASLCAAAQADPQRAAPTFSLALAALPDPHWSALSPASPLRRWRLIEVGSGSSLVTSPLRIDERVLHYLAGVQHLDEHLLGFVQPLATRAPSGEMLRSQQELVERIAALWSRAKTGDLLPVAQLTGYDRASKQAIAVAAAAQLGLNLYVMAAQALPVAPHDLEALIRLWEREAALSNSALLLDCDDGDPADTARESLISSFLENVGGVLMVASRERRKTALQRPIATFEVVKPTSREQRILWDETLGAAAPSLNGQVDRLVAQFDLSAATIAAAYRQATEQALPYGVGTLHATSLSTESDSLGALLWDACRNQVSPRLNDLAQRIEPVATWDDLVLPERQLRTLHDVAIHVRQRARVYEQWGFAAKSSRGMGITALFAGASGTGKTMAAEVLANELHLDLYRIDLSQVVSKYIGETEKNLRRVFDAADEGGAILLFDEADALFGKRSEVKDSHDRYANIEISYLLQRMEVYRGLAILTTNMKNALDDAFMRRIRFVVQFPFPDAIQRAEIWRRIFPARTPTDGLDAEKLAHLNVAGGNICNIALHAAFVAAEAGEPVRMAHLVQAARVEYTKLEKPLTESEIRGWV